MSGIGTREPIKNRILSSSVGMARTARFAEHELVVGELNEGLALLAAVAAYVVHVSASIQSQNASMMPGKMMAAKKHSARMIESFTWPPFLGTL